MSHGLIFLVGFMGSGKTTAGALLAEKLNYQFTDLDQLIEKDQACSIAEIFEKQGEGAFREIERKILMELLSKQQLVVATGGGCPAYESNMALMNQNGLTVYLQCKPGYLFHRLAPAKLNRPLIAHMGDIDLMDFIINQLKNRLPYYVQAAVTVNSEGSPAQTVINIDEQIRKITSS